MCEYVSFLSIKKQRNLGETLNRIHRASVVHGMRASLISNDEEEKKNKYSKRQEFEEGRRICDLGTICVRGEIISRNAYYVCVCVAQAFDRWESITFWDILMRRLILTSGLGKRTRTYFNWFW